MLIKKVYLIFIILNIKLIILYYNYYNSTQHVQYTKTIFEMGWWENPND